MTSPSRARVAAVALLVIACCWGGHVVVVQAAGSARTVALGTAKQPAPSPRPATAAPGTTVRVTGRLTTKVVRTVVLQRQAGRTWRRVTASRTDEHGRYRLRLTARGVTTRLRIKAPALDTRKRHYRQVVSATAVLRVAGDPSPTPTPTPTPTSTPTPDPGTLTLGLPVSAVAGGPDPTAVVTTTGLAPGAPVTLQRRSGAHWVAVTTGALDANGTARIPVPLGDVGPGPAVLRATAAGGQASGTRDLDVAPPGAIVTPGDDDGVDGRFDVEVAVSTGLTATRVRLFLDGFVLPDPAAPVPGQPGRWTASVDPAAVPLARRHVDLTARVTTADGSALTEPVRLDVRPSTGGLPPGFRVDTVASGLDLPTSFAPLDDHRVLVTEKAGLVRMVTDGVVAPTPVLDLRAVVADTADSGILDVVLDPGYAQNGWFYLSYVADDGGATSWHTNRVVRYTLTGDTADPASAHIVLGTVPLATCTADATTPGCFVNKDGMHTVDDLLFDDTGALLVSVGDGAAGDPSRAVVAQRLDVLAGKVLRVDPATGLGLPDNPYVVSGQPGANRSRVLAYGFRNPFRMALSPGGVLYVGDVGEVAWEEVDRVVAGGNYGWPCFEGPDPGTAPAGDPDCAAVRSGSTTHRTPLIAYPHADFAGSVTLGAFAEDGAYPAPYDGRLFLGDYTMGKVWTLDVDAAERLEDFGTPPGLGAGVKYAAGPDGDIWYADIASGSLRRIIHDPQQTSCPSGEFLAETFRNRDLEPEEDGRPWLTSCVGSPPAGPSYNAPGDPNDGNGWSMRWSGTPQLAPGTYRLTAQASGTITVTVDGHVVPDGGAFTVAGSDVNEATADVEVVLRNHPPFDDVPFFVDFDWNYLLSWQRVGTAPSVTLHDLGPGERVAPGSTIGWTASATDADDGQLPAADLRVRVTQLHYGTGNPHAHPAGSFAGAEGSFTVDDTHAPGKIAFRVVGVATDSSGWVAESDPVYVCLVGGAVGPCS